MKAHLVTYVTLPTVHSVCTCRYSITVPRLHDSTDGNLVSLFKTSLDKYRTSLRQYVFS